MPSVDGHVLPVPKKNLQAYARIARMAGKVWRDHGALEVREGVADDAKPGKHTSLPQSVKLKAGETVAFSWIVSSRAPIVIRSTPEVMKDPRLAQMMDPKALPFDAKACFMADLRYSSRFEQARAPSIEQVGFSPRALIQIISSTISFAAALCRYLQLPVSGTVITSSRWPSGSSK